MFDRLPKSARTDQGPINLLPIDHVGIAVHDTAAALALYQGIFGLCPEPTEIVLGENIKVTFLDGANCRVELLEPLPGDSAVARFLEKRGEGMHHVCFAVPDIVATLHDLGSAGYQLVDEQPRRGRHGELLAFVHPRATHGVLIELYQLAPTGQGVTGGWTNGGSHPPEAFEAGESRSR